MKVFFSQSLEKLAVSLGEELFSSKGHPLEKKDVVVPDQWTKNYLMRTWADQFGIAAGIDFSTLATLIALPSFIELSLHIEQALTKSQDEALIKYLAGGLQKRRIALADHLSALFLRYDETGEEMKEGWQKEIWKQVWPESIDRDIKEPLYIFNPGFLSKKRLSYLEKFNPKLFILSPSQMYWGDFRTKWEQRDLFDPYFSEQNFLLTTCGKVGRELLRNLDCFDIESEEEYSEIEGESLLKTLQREVLTLVPEEKKADETVRVIAAPSRLEEVEFIYEWLITHKPSDVTVLAPDISHYEPYIHMVFGGRSDYAIFDLPLKSESSVAQGLQTLIDIAKGKEGHKALFYNKALQKKFFPREEEVKTMMHWLDWFWPEARNFTLEALATEKEGYPRIELSEAETLGQWMSVHQLLEKELIPIQEEQHFTLFEWMAYLHKIVKLFFGGDEIIESNLRSYKKIKTEPLPFESVERILTAIFDQRTLSFQSSHLHAIKFAQIKSPTPSKVVILMGLDETTFPRSGSKSSLYDEPKTYLPTQIESDRDLFLESLLSAENGLIITYPYIDESDGQEMRPSPIVDELLTYVPDLKIEYLARKRDDVKAVAQTPHITKSPKQEIDIRDIARFAAHPVDAFLRGRCKIRVERKKEIDRSVVCPWFEFSDAREQSLSKDLPNMIETLKKTGRLPHGVFEEAAIDRLQSEIKSYHEKLELCGVDPKTIFSAENLSLKLPGGRVIVGTLNDLSPHGLLFHGDDDLETLIKVWPLWLIARAAGFGSCLILTKEGVIKEGRGEEADLVAYLDYYEKAMETPSPLLPSWAPALLEEKSIPKKEDEVMSWYKERFEPIDIERWRPYLKEVFRAAF